MYRFLKTLERRELITQQLPIVATSLMIAEFFYKFHSFSLEAGAFLLTWYALDALVNFTKKSK